MIHSEASRLEKNVLSPDDETALRTALKRCSPLTVEAACAFRKTGDVSQVPVIVLGVIERFVERDLRPKLQQPTASELRLIEDLNMDSLTLFETVLLLEEVLKITIDNEELPALRTLEQIQRFTERKLSNLPSPSSAPSSPVILSRSLEPRVSRDHPRRLAERTDLATNTTSTAME